MPTRGSFGNRWLRRRARGRSPGAGVKPQLAAQTPAASDRRDESRPVMMATATLTISV